MAGSTTASRSGVEVTRCIYRFPRASDREPGGGRQSNTHALMTHPTSLAGVLRTANWLFTPPPNWWGSLALRKLAVRMCALAHTSTKHGMSRLRTQWRWVASGMSAILLHGSGLHA